MKRLSFGHGFVPRIGRQNYKALERALAPPSLFGDEPSDVPWVIVDGAWATPDTPLLSHLRALGIKILVDTQGWRFGDERTQEIRKYARLDHRPAAPLSIDAIDDYVEFIHSDIEWQLKLGADALLMPGLMPENDDDRAIRSLGLAVEVAMTSESSAQRPLIGFLGVHSQSLGQTASHATDPMIQLLSALYVQVTPVDPMSDSVSKLVHVADTMLHFEDLGMPVVAGHLGGFGGALRALGVTAADAGLGSSETFDAKRLLRAPTRKKGDSNGGGSSARRYLAQLLRSVNPSQWSALMAVDSLRGFLDCRLGCCRHRTIEDRTDWSREHSLRTRVAEAADLAGYAPSMRASRQSDLMHAARASLVTVNSALQISGHKAIPTEHVENQLAALGRLISSRTAV
jgi:hypothetical protein